MSEIEASPAPCPFSLPFALYDITAPFQSLTPLLGMGLSLVLRFCSWPLRTFECSLKTVIFGCTGFVSIRGYCDAVWGEDILGGGRLGAMRLSNSFIKIDIVQVKAGCVQENSYQVDVRLVIMMLTWLKRNWIHAKNFCLYVLGLLMKIMHL